MRPSVIYTRRLTTLARTSAPLFADIAHRLVPDPQVSDPLVVTADGAFPTRAAACRTAAPNFALENPDGRVGRLRDRR